jgi:bifunctional DNase/RNase
MHVEIKVRSVRATADNDAALIILEAVNGSAIVPLWSGIHEALAIVNALEPSNAGRPSTHDLTITILEALQTRLLKIVIDDLIDETFHATLWLEHTGKTFTCDSRPSDAIALAVRTNSPMLIDDKLFALLPRTFKQYQLKSAPAWTLQ